METRHRDIPQVDAIQHAEFDVDDLLDALTNTRRRFVLGTLSAATRPVAIADLATDLTAWEEDIPSNQVSLEQAKARYIDLYHVHLPKLEALGLVTRETDTGAVSCANETGTAVSALV